MESQSQRSITLRELAKFAGVSHSTASRALNDSPKISKATKLKVKALARELRYSPDLKSSALSKYRTSQAASTPEIRVALVTSAEAACQWTGFASAAKEHALRLGYEFELYEWNEDSSPAWHCQVLKERGVKGILLGPLSSEAKFVQLGFQWENFAIIALGRFVASPKLDCITENSFQSMRSILEKCLERNYMPAGLLALKHFNLNAAFRIQSAFNSFWDIHPDVKPVEELIVDTPFDTDRIARWIEHENLKTIISHRSLMNELLKSGFRFPPDMQFIALDLKKTQLSHHQTCGIIHDDVEAARTAVSAIHDYITSGYIGFPRTPKDILLEGKWNEGETLISKIRETCREETLALQP